MNSYTRRQLLKDFIETARSNDQETGLHLCVRGRKLAHSIPGVSELRTKRHDHLAEAWWSDYANSFGCTILTRDGRVVQLISREELKAHLVIR